MSGGKTEEWHGEEGVMEGVRGEVEVKKGEG